MALRSLIEKLPSYRLLREYGLTGYEALTLLYLASVQEATPREISEKTGVPYTKVYEVIRKLHGRGWIEVIEGRPIVCKFRSLDCVIKSIRDDLERKFRELESSLAEDVARLRFAQSVKRPTAVVVYRLPEAIEYVVSSVRAAQHAIWFLIAYVDDVLQQVLAKLRVGAEVEIRAIISQSCGNAVLALLKTLSKRCSIKYIKSLVPLNLVLIDLAKVIFIPSYVLATTTLKPSILVVDDSEVAITTKNYLEFLWRHASS
ncbi:MAG: hypothetical protein DRJ40_07890 [Thermoprotei archaeon]|nr:MAG: hypothetical protein DRJ40_07890 [Thermoprotei archaeon]